MAKEEINLNVPSIDEKLVEAEELKSEKTTEETNVEEPKSEETKVEKTNVFKGEVETFVSVNDITLKLIPGTSYPDLVVEAFPELF